VPRLPIANPLLDNFGAFDPVNLVNPYAFVSGGAFSPSDIATLRRWIKADALGGGLSDGDPISTAADASGNGNDLTQAGANRPTYQTNITNGLPAIQFDRASAQYLDGSVVTSASAKSWAIAYEPSGSAASMNLLGTDNNDDYYILGGTTDGYFGSFRAARINTYPAVVPASGVHIITGISSGSAYQIWIDGVAQGAQGADYSEGTDFLLGNNLGLSRPFDGYIYEYCEFIADIGSTDRASVESYLGRWL
jgi:hypothetical protein